MASIDYGNILKRSFELTKRHKWLWVYGLTLAIFSSGGGGSSSNLGEIIKEAPDKIPQDLPEKTTYVLGQTTSLIREWFSAVPLTTWLLIGMGIVGLISLWLIVSWIVRSWAKGSLIIGVSDADQNMPVTLLSTSSRGITKVKHLILFGLISIGLGIAATVVALLITLSVVFVGSILTQTAVKVIWFGLWLLAIVLTSVIAVILFSMIAVYADRLIVLKNYSPWAAWKKGLSLSRHHFIPTVVMGIINQAVGCTVGCLSTIILMVILGIPGALLVLPHFKDGFRLPSLPVIGVLILLILLFIYTNYLINALLTVFRFGNWNLFFKEVISQEETV